jgi:hypothetical protein
VSIYFDQIVVRCDGENPQMEDGKCDRLKVYDKGTAYSDIAEDLGGWAWTIHYNQQFCDIHGHQAPRRKETHAGKDGNENEEEP